MEVGAVISLNPGEGTSVAKDTEVVITVSTGEGNDMVSVANVRGIDASEAEATLTAQGLIVEIEEVDGDEVDVAYGEVYAQTPKAGNRVEKGTTVTIKVRKEGAGSDAGTTADGNKVEAGQWAAVEPKLKKPDNYQGGNVQLRLVGSPIDFDSNGGYYSVGSIVGKEGMESGTLYLAEQQENGEYQTLWSYPLTFTEVE